MIHLNRSAKTRLLLPFLFMLMTSGFYSQAQTTGKIGTLNDINFLDGRWLGTYNGGPIEAAWTAPAGGSIVGYIRMTKDDKPSLYEIFAFEQTEKGPVALIKHFKPGMISLEEKDVRDTYHFLEAKKNQALFEKDDVSVRIIYELRTKNQLVIQRGKLESGKWAFIDLFVFNRIP
jgi:hypothetical protein